MKTYEVVKKYLKLKQDIEYVFKNMFVVNKIDGEEKWGVSSYEIELQFRGKGYIINVEVRKEYTSFFNKDMELLSNEDDFQEKYSYELKQIFFEND